MRKRKHPITVMASKAGICVQIMTDDCSAYACHIRGEGGDICLYRAMQDKRLVGALLPLHNWNGKIITTKV